MRTLIVQMHRVNPMKLLQKNEPVSGSFDLLMQWLRLGKNVEKRGMYKLIHEHFDQFFAPVKLTYSTSMYIKYFLTTYQNKSELPHV